MVGPHRFPDLEPERTVLEPLGAAVVAAADADELVRRAGDVDALLVATTRVDASLVARLQRCRAIVRYGMGVDGVDVAAATRAGIPVGNVPDASVADVADHAVALALALMRRLPDLDDSVRAGRWGLAPLAGVRRVGTRTAGIVGLGRIGRAVAGRLGAFGMRVVAYDPLAGTDPYPGLDLEDLLGKADLVSLHVPLTPETANLLSADRLSRLPPGAIVVNVSRGGLVDEHALARALREGRLGGAGIDTFADEPLPPAHPLRDAPRTILTPHAAWHSVDAARDLQRKAAEQVARAIAGQRLAPVVNAEVYPDGDG
jgi:D-3-phosphoglycerate dehydrogenase